MKRGHYKEYQHRDSSKKKSRQTEHDQSQRRGPAQIENVFNEQGYTYFISLDSVL